MQTFLPLPSFIDSARVLDRARLGKQRVEAKQLVQALTDDPRRRISWRNHPAARMWKGYTASLVNYGYAICTEWIARGYEDNTRSFFAQLGGGQFQVDPPPWFGDEAFHRAHRSNLMRKDPVWYGQFGWDVPDDLPYIWPK